MENEKAKAIPPMNQHLNLGENEQDNEIFEEFSQEELNYGSGGGGEPSIQSENSDQELEMVRKRTQTNRQNLVRQSILANIYTEGAKQKDQRIRELEEELEELRETHSSFKKQLLKDRSEMVSKEELELAKKEQEMKSMHENQLIAL